ncbi:camp-regulated phosphoprotein/endosulfine conserved region-domain-containing protein, partial [Terfezia claveryi]
MLPHQKNKVDINSLSEEEQKLFRLYGKLPSRKDVLGQKLKERKYFDSGDYALSKAGKASDVGVTTIGSKHPLPENIPHSHNPTGTTITTGGTAASPAKESSGVHAKSP